MNTRIVGRRGEDVATAYFEAEGYTILDRNFACRLGEIDIVAWDGEYVVFVEVKSRADTAFGLPREAVDWQKQRKIVKVAEYWLFKNRQTGLPVRFDVLEVLDGEVNHIVDAFRPQSHYGYRKR